jgi:hypothetical protein
MIPRGMRAAAGRLDRPCRRRRPFSLGNNRNKYGRNRTTKITG